MNTLMTVNKVNTHKAKTQDQESQQKQQIKEAKATTTTTTTTHVGQKQRGQKIAQITDELITQNFA